MIAFVSVNDVFVMKAWGEAQGVSGQVQCSAAFVCYASQMISEKIGNSSQLSLSKRCFYFLTDRYAC